MRVQRGIIKYNVFDYHAIVLNLAPDETTSKCFALDAPYIGNQSMTSYYIIFMCVRVFGANATFVSNKDKAIYSWEFIV